MGPAAYHLPPVGALRGGATSSLRSSG